MTFFNMNKRMLYTGLAVFVLLLSFSLSSCKNEPVISPDEPTVCFQEQVYPIIKSNCAISGCHSAASHEEGPVLDSYENILANVEPFKPSKSKIWRAITRKSLIQQAMPPSSRTPLTLEQTNLISIWILQGAQNNSCQQPCDTTNVTFSGNVWPIVTTWCTGCHSGTDPQGGLRLENYDQVAAIANNGKFYGAVAHLPGYVPMPFESPKLSDCSLATIRLWIEGGALNN
jgi:hypothetical protein